MFQTKKTHIIINKKYSYRLKLSTHYEKSTSETWNSCSAEKSNDFGSRCSIRRPKAVMRKGLMAPRELRKANSPFDMGCMWEISPGFPEEPFQGDINYLEERD